MTTPNQQTAEEITNPVLFVGAGPGDPELITVKGRRTLEEADVVVYAGSLVPKEMLTWTRPGTDHKDSAGMHLEEIVEHMVSGYKAGRKVVRLHTGDPSLYGAIFEQMAQLSKHGVPYRVIPGVTAAFAAAAAMGIEYTLPEISQTLILTRMAGRTPVPETESLETLAAHKTTMAIYLSISLVDKVTKILSDAYGPDAGCAVVYRASQPDEKILYMKVKDLAAMVRKENITRQALIIVGRILDVSLDRLSIPSRLYDRHFTHGFRKADDR